jgi:hypothetical protein
MAERPTSDDGHEQQKASWAAQGMRWRTEPEINQERKAYLAERRAVKPNIKQGIYPFRDENGEIKLTRADVEWLLATLESNGWVGPVNWDDLAQREREGLDVRGADLSNLNLKGLPLARLHGGLAEDDWFNADECQRARAAVCLTSSRFMYAHLEGAILTYGRLEGADFRECHLEGAELTYGHLEADMPAKLRLAFFDQETQLDGLVLANDQHVGPHVVDARWGGVNLAIVEWARVWILGEEQSARNRFHHGKRKSPASQLWDYERAVRANRQLSTVLRAQGLNEHGDRFAYRAQLLQRQVLRRQRKYGRACGSWLLDAIAGYGYKPIRSVYTYLLVVLGFAAAYFALTNFGPVPFFLSHSSPLQWYEALVLSIFSFHGRGLFPNNISLGDPIAILAAFEAIIGLLIEITFIATFTQRFFAR